MAVVVLKDGVPVDKKGRKTWVYAFLLLDEGNIIKIGFTSDIQRRAKDIRMDRRSRIEVLGVMPAAQVDENRIHRQMFSCRAFPHRAFSEYYKPIDQILAFISMRMVRPECYGLDIKCSNRPFDINRSYKMMKHWHAKSDISRSCPAVAS